MTTMSAYPELDLPAPAAETAPPHQGDASVVQPANVEPDQADAGSDPADSADSDLGLQTPPATESKPEPPVKGLAIAKRPGSKKPASAKPVAAQPETTPEPVTEAPSASTNGESANGDAPDEPASTPTAPEPPVKGLGIAPGVRRPGKR